jgi:hypothetical protein
MKFECGDLERALAVPELMAEAKEHLKECAVCRREYRLWTEISSVAKELHEEWDSPNLWPDIRRTLEAQPRPARAWWADWKTWSFAATVVVGVALFFRPWQLLIHTPRPSTVDYAGIQNRTTLDQTFLTEQALREVEKNEAAYRQSIDRLSELAKPKLDSPASAVSVGYHEKLLLIDSAISETRANLDQNRFNVGLQNDLAGLYRQKQQTLQELLTNDQKN